MSNIAEIIGGPVKRVTVAIGISASGATLVALVAGRKIRVLSMVLAPNVATTIQLKSDTTAISQVLDISAAPIVFPFSPYGWWETDAGEALKVDSGSGAVDFEITYAEVE